MKCNWCEYSAYWIVVFGNLTTMEVWDLRLCDAHTAQLEDYREGPEPVYAPDYDSRDTNMDQFADMWEIESIPSVTDSTSHPPKVGC